MASTINAGTTTATGLQFTSDTSGALTIKTGGVNAISISSSQEVTLANALPIASGGTGITSFGTGVQTALGQSVTGSGSIVLAASPTLTGTPLAPTAATGTNTTQLATTAFVLANGVPSGVILLWSGSVASIPTGWYLCNGANGTPDLRNNFVVGAGSTYSVGATGGSANSIVVSHTHSVVDPGHLHAQNGQTVGPGAGSYAFAAGSFDVPVNNTDTNTTGISISSTGSSGTNANLPPYYALAYIMKA